uniref:CUB domain-containing protein n=1 Tax=Macrostomum lignano TaxID=282301 RepID=A0A1I8F8P5_9PLAT
MYDSWKYPLLLKFPSNSAGPSVVQSICQNLDSRPKPETTTAPSGTSICLYLLIREFLPNSKRHYSQISCGFDLDYRPGYSILLRISHNLGFEDIDFYCHSKLSSRDVNPHIVAHHQAAGLEQSGANWIEEAAWKLPSCPELQCRSLNSGQPGCQNISVSSMRLEAQLARTPESRAAAASDCNCPCHDCDAYGQHMTVGRKAAGGPAATRSLVICARLQAPLAGSATRPSRLEINVSVTFIDCNRNASLRQCRMARTQVWGAKQFMLSGRTPGGLVFLAIVLTLLLLGCLLFIQPRGRWQPSSRAAHSLSSTPIFHSQQQCNHSTATFENSTTSAHRSGEEMSRTPATGSAQAGRQESSLSPSADIEQSQQHSTEERLARPLTRQRGEEAEVADVDFVLQEAPQRIVVRVSLVTPHRHRQRRPSRSRSLYSLASSRRAKEGQHVGDMDHTVFQASERGFLGSQYTGGVLYFLESASAFTASYTRRLWQPCWPAG